VSLFVLIPEIEDRDEVEVGSSAKHKKTFYSECHSLFLQGSVKLCLAMHILRQLPLKSIIL
jgi:hypothetical protein